MSEEPLVVACIPAYNEEGSMGSVVVRALRYVGRVVVCGDGSVDLTGAFAGGLGAVVGLEFGLAERHSGSCNSRYDRYVSNIPGVYMVAMPVVAALLPAYNWVHRVAAALLSCS